MDRKSFFKKLFFTASAIVVGKVAFPRNDGRLSEEELKNFKIITEPPSGGSYNGLSLEEIKRLKKEAVKNQNFDLAIEYRRQEKLILGIKTDELPRGFMSKNQLKELTERYNKMAAQRRKYLNDKA